MGEWKSVYNCVPMEIASKVDGSMEKPESEHWEHFIDYTFGENTEYVPLKILDGGLDHDVFTASKDDPAFRITHTFHGDQKVSAHITTRVHVLLDENNRVERAYREDCVITGAYVFTRIDPQYVHFTVTDIGNRVNGTFDMNTMTFRESDDSPLNMNWWCADIRFEELLSMFHTGKLISVHDKYIWTLEKASQFIESILYGLPIQSLTIATDDSNKRKIIVDGYQRIMTGYYYVREGTFALPNSSGINGRWRNKSFQELSEEEQSRIEKALFRINVINIDNLQDGENILSRLFERINGRRIKEEWRGWCDGGRE